MVISLDVQMSVAEMILVGPKSKTKNRNRNLNGIGFPSIS